ncbi:MAG: PEP-utilizing enzyme [Acidimicrobiales bacterium]
MDIRWEAPAPGQWARDRSHMPPGCTPILQHIASTAMPAGMRRMFAEFGTPLDTLDVRFVNGQFYSRLRPLISPDRPATKLPPLPLLKLAVRLHPEMRRRAKRAARLFAERPWNRVIDEWHHGGKDRLVEANLALQDVDLASLTDADLVAHLQRVIAHGMQSWEHHFWLHGFDLGPLGQYLHEVMPWGVTADQALSLLEGASPSTSAPMRELTEIRSVVEASGARPTDLAGIRAISPEIDRRVAHYLRFRGAVLFSRYDVDGVTLGERPDLVAASILNAEVHDTTAEVAERIARVRASVPAEHRDRFDELLREARAAMDLRDDNGPTTAEWPLGLVRLTLLELGRRLVAAGRIPAVELVFELKPEELVPAVLTDGPSAAELERRADERRRWRTADAPLVLGEPELAPPPEVLPADMARLVGVVSTVMAHLGMDGADHADGMTGVGVGTRSVRARARVAATPEEALDVLEPGDVLVVAGTTPAYNLVLSLAGGVVTADGGPMCHAAVIARELGIPAVIGARAALTDIPDGAMVELDPTTGRVRVLAEA